MLTWSLSGCRCASAVPFPLTHLDGALLSVVLSRAQSEHPFNGWWARKMVFYKRTATEFTKQKMRFRCR